MAQRHVIYGLYDPTDPEQKVRYVGYTHLTPEQRIIDHVSNARRKAETHKQKWIRKLLRNNVEPAYVILEVTTAKNWKARETYWIASLREAGNRLTNSTDGGDGLINPSKDVRKRISEKVSVIMTGNQYRKGIRGTPEFGARQSETLRNSKRFKKAQAKWRGIARHIPTKAERKALSILKTGVPRPDMQWFGKAQAKKNEGSFWVNDGVENKLLRKGDSIPEGFVIGRLMIRKVTTKGKRYVTNGQENRMLVASEPIPSGFRPGCVKDESWRTPSQRRKMGRKVKELKLGFRWICRGDKLRQLPKENSIPKGWKLGRG